MKKSRKKKVLYSSLLIVIVIFAILGIYVSDYYPGGKVEYTAYEPLMLACAERGILCVLTQMPFHLAVLDINAAAGIQDLFPKIQKWYIGGHSLGGSMAASFLEITLQILTASYSSVLILPLIFRKVI